MNHGKKIESSRTKYLMNGRQQRVLKFHTLNKENYLLLIRARSNITNLPTYLTSQTGKFASLCSSPFISGSIHTCITVAELNLS